VGQSMAIGHPHIMAGSLLGNHRVLAQFNRVSIGIVERLNSLLHQCALHRDTLPVR